MFARGLGHGAKVIRPPAGRPVVPGRLDGGPGHPRNDRLGRWTAGGAR
jgi:hypothetical protein